MSMVGLFWITGTAAHIGAPPNEPGPGVLLTEEGLTGLGADQSGRWTWDGIQRVTVAGVPVRSSGRRAAGTGVALRSAPVPWTNGLPERACSYTSSENWSTE
ncbi:hypothetical protein OG609_21835 [Streptomyces sp. NBC_01224]|uniref:hypothetical protein n=1 Tax=unclassified Streptomyces TaxID=2593676 RepID=UPI002E0EDC2F|nr:hypothetical protein OG609_21835 [Streptomyces sp. NBC_01224]